MNGVTALKMPLVVAAKEFDFERLMGNQSQLVLEAQLLYRNSRGEVYVASIDNENHHYTVADYLSLPEGAPFQLIKNKLIYMPSPFVLHQMILGNLHLLIGSYVKQHKLGFVGIAPLDVHFDEANVFQPDLLFISNDRMDILQKWVYGAPDLVVEILSKGTAKIDRSDKMEVCGQHGVREYWLIDPKKQRIEVYENEKNKLHLSQKIEKTGLVTSAAVPGFSFELTTLFE
jgi:Uma2 family endonuclease